MPIEKEPVKQRNKELTKRKLINAVGEIIRTQGYTGLGVNKIAKKAEVSKKLIYRYFGNVDNLIEEYIVEKDYWTTYAKQIQKIVIDNRESPLKEIVTHILESQFNYFFTEAEMQKIVLWELSEANPLMRSICNVREQIGSEFFKLTDEHFKNSNINFRGVGALLVAGIYYLVLHAKTNGSTFCEIDINKESGRNEILKAIKLINEWAFQAGNKNTKASRKMRK